MLELLSIAMSIWTNFSVKWFGLSWFKWSFKACNLNNFCLVYFCASFWYTFCIFHETTHFSLYWVLKAVKSVHLYPGLIFQISVEYLWCHCSVSSFLSFFFLKFISPLLHWCNVLKELHASLLILFFQLSWVALTHSFFPLSVQSVLSVGYLSPVTYY